MYYTLIGTLEAKQRNESLSLGPRHNAQQAPATSLALRDRSTRTRTRTRCRLLLCHASVHKAIQAGLLVGRSTTCVCDTSRLQVGFNVLVETGLLVRRRP
jgi:hypothetical protein